MDFSSSKFNKESENHKASVWNNFPRRYNIISNDVIFPALCAGWCLINKVLVHFCKFLCATFNFEYDFLDTSTTLDAKVLEYSPEVNL